MQSRIDQFVGRPVFRSRVVMLVILALAGCDRGQPSSPSPDTYSYEGYGSGDGYGYGASEITFLDQAPSNAATEVGLSNLSVTTIAGETTRVSDLAGKNGIVVVVTRGNTNPICPYCSTQTAHYIRDYEEFRRREVEVMIVYPIESRGDSERIDAFLTDARGRVGDPNRPVPFPVVFDVELSAVDQLGIRKDLSKPATYILDAAGEVVYAYVGAHWGDRPAVSAILEELESKGLTAESSSTNSDGNGQTPDLIDPAGPERNSAAADGSSN